MSITNYATMLLLINEHAHVKGFRPNNCITYKKKILSWFEIRFSCNTHIFREWHMGLIVIEIKHQIMKFKGMHKQKKRHGYYLSNQFYYYFLRIIYRIEYRSKDFSFQFCTQKKCYWGIKCFFFFMPFRQHFLSFLGMKLEVKSEITRNKEIYHSAKTTSFIVLRFWTFKDLTLNFKE